ncbi:MAG: type II toxin-antitoxin system RelE/ParE family toxin [Lachnospiraceae bacterium]|nr:type II toxin-antitoxin system RelE/ParE family toxin [Lachnospiraceae bacterium]
MPMYDVITLPLAEEDIINNTDYIAYKKKSPDTALRLAIGFRNRIADLEFMPEQHELDEDEELAARGIRKCYYKNYKIYFYINTERKAVYILRVLHMLVNAKPLLLKTRF